MASPSIGSQNDNTIRPSLAQSPTTTASKNSVDSASTTTSRKAFFVAEQKLADFFTGVTDTCAPKRKYSDANLQQIANLLRLSHRQAWSAIPRIYTVLRNIGQLQLIDEFLGEDFTDIWFPFTSRNLPAKLSPSVKAQFLNTQSVVFTQSLDLEKGEGKHATFAADEPLWFESRGKLGRGAFGVVDKVVSLITLQEYARKRMRRGNSFTNSKREIKAFKAELAILKTVNHRHCIRLVGSYTDPVYLGLIMDPVADSDLAVFLASALTDNDKKSLLRTFFGCLSSALQYLHERQIRHRDIKPPNILVKGDTVYLADFGIALDWSEMTRGTTTADTAKSPIYCAPEVARCEPRGTSADIWSLGCVFVEMITVLKGRSVEDMRSYFKMASSSYMFHHNIEACNKWLADLKQISEIDNPPIEWSKKMLIIGRNERYTADQLLETIQLASEHDPSRFVNQNFCGDCCMDEEHISSGGSVNGEDPWAESEDDDTVRAHAALDSKTSPGKSQVSVTTDSGEGVQAPISELFPQIIPPIDAVPRHSLNRKSRDPSMLSQLVTTSEPKNSHIQGNDLDLEPILSSEKGFLATISRDKSSAGSDQSQKRGCVLDNFTAIADDEVTVDAGDIVLILNNTKSTYWWKVLRVKDGKEGVIPSSYIDLSAAAEPSGTTGVKTGQALFEQNLLETRHLIHPEGSERISEHPKRGALAANPYKGPIYHNDPVQIESVGVVDKRSANLTPLNDDHKILSVTSSIEPPEPPRSKTPPEVYVRRHFTFTLKPPLKNSSLSRTKPVPLPRVELDARLPCPAILKCGELLPLRILFRRLSLSSIPVFLVSLQIILTRNEKSKEKTKWALTSYFGLKIFLGKVDDELQTYHVVDDNLWNMIKVPNTQPTSFLTSYELEVRVGLGCYRKATPDSVQAVEIPLRFQVKIYPSTSKLYTDVPGSTFVGNYDPDGKSGRALPTHGPANTRPDVPVAKRERYQGKDITDSAATKYGPYSDDEDGNALPILWERRKRPDGRSYYVDHNTRNTTWDAPKPAAFKPTPTAVNNSFDWDAIFAGLEDPATAELPPRLSNKE